nr:MAG TPA: hypothetical protein [Caudoviricetes sp.]
MCWVLRVRQICSCKLYRHAPADGRTAKTHSRDRSTAEKERCSKF